MSIYNGIEDISSGENYSFVRIEDIIYIGDASAPLRLIDEHLLAPEIKRLRDKYPRALDAGLIRYLGYQPIVVVSDFKKSEYLGFIPNRTSRGETILTLMRMQDPLRPVEFIEPSELQPAGVSRERFR